MRWKNVDKTHDEEYSFAQEFTFFLQEVKMIDAELVMSQGLFDERLKHRRPKHDVYAEDGNMLMSKLEALSVQQDVRGLVSGFVTPHMNPSLKKEVLQLSAISGWTTTIKQGICTPQGGGPPFAHYTLIIIRA